MFSQKTLRAHQKKKVLFPKMEIYKNINVINNHFEKIKYMPACWRMRCQRTTKKLIKTHLTRWQKELRTASKEINSNAQNWSPEHWIYFEKRNLDTAGGQSDFVQFIYAIISRYQFLFSSCAYLEFCNGNMTLVSQYKGPKVPSYI